MKQINAIIRPEKLNDVRKALDIEETYGGITISDVMGQGTQKGIVQAWRGEKYEIDLIPKVMISLVVNDDNTDKIISAISDNARTGEIGDGKIFVMNIEEVIRIRTGEDGEGAI